MSPAEEALRDATRARAILAACQGVWPATPGWAELSAATRAGWMRVAAALEPALGPEDCPACGKALRCLACNARKAGLASGRGSAKYAAACKGAAVRWARHRARLAAIEAARQAAEGASTS